MRLFLLISTFILSGCASQRSLTYRDVLKGMPVSYRITEKMNPVIEKLYADNLAAYAGQENADSIAVSETAKDAGRYLVGFYKAGKFVPNWKPKEKELIRQSSISND